VVERSPRHAQGRERRCCSSGRAGVKGARVRLEASAQGASYSPPWLTWIDAASARVARSCARTRACCAPDLATRSARLGRCESSAAHQGRRARRKTPKDVTAGSGTRAQRERPSAQDWAAGDFYDCASPRSCQSLRRYFELTGVLRCCAGGAPAGCAQPLGHWRLSLG
jgi:hypothetical protein